MTTLEQPLMYEFGDFRLDSGRHSLCRLSTGSCTALTPRVFDTLRVLIEHAGALITKSELMDAVWPHAVVEENNLDQNISTLRRLLGDRPGDPRYIRTERGRGYRFVATVRLLDGPDAGQIFHSIEKEAAASPIRIPRGWGLAISAAVILAGSFLLLAPDSTPVSTMERIPSLAVLPFRSADDANRNESLELGVAETLIRQLHSPVLTVSPVSTVRRFANSLPDAVLAGRALEVDSVLEGDLQLDGQRLRISVRLLRVEDGARIWTQTYEREFADIFTVQDAIAAAVRTALAVGTPTHQRSPGRHSTEDPIAFQHYVSGRFFRLQGSEASLRQALAHFQQAVQRDPDFALAHVGVAESHAVLGVFGAAAPHVAFPPALEAANRALALASDLGEAHASLGHIRMLYGQDWTGAEQALRRAIELSPNYAPAHQWLGLQLGVLGRFDEAMAALRQAQELDASPIYSGLVGKLLNYQRRYDEAIDQLQSTLAMAPELPPAHTYLAVAYLRRGDFERAREHLDRAISTTPGSAAYRGQMLALTGRHAEAIVEIQRLIDASQEQYVSAYDIATIHATLGDADETLAWLERAIDDRSQLIGWVRWEPVFDPFREDPRYAALLARLDFPD